MTEEELTIERRKQTNIGAIEEISTNDEKENEQKETTPICPCCGSRNVYGMSRVQLETLVIDLITDELYPELNYEERGKIRGVTKRSFYRTLEQARMNLIRAIFTIMVAAVLNIIDSPRLSNFNNLSQTFMDLIEVNKVEDQTPEEKEKWIKVYTKIIFEKTEELKKQTALNKPK
jgi:predicted DNA-binding protein (UPF0251 family)